MTKFQNLWPRFDYILILLMGLAFLLVSYLLIYRGPVLVDEVMYVVVGRNLAEQGTLNTNLYWTESIVKHGYPTRDYHAPGYMITVAAFFAALGASDWVIGLPNQIAYVVAGIIFYSIGKSLVTPAKAVLAAFIFYLYPINFIYANLVMVETGLALLAVIFIALWLKISRSETPHYLHLILLAATIVGGMLYRQTFVVFLPPALFILTKFGLTHKNYCPLVVFSALFFILLAGVYWPLTQNRSYYPNPYDQVIEAAAWSAKAQILLTTFVNNLQQTFAPEPIQRPMALVYLILALVSVGAVYSKNSAYKMLAWLFFYLFWASALMFTVFYKSVVDLTIARNLAAYVLPGLFLFVAVIFEVKHRLLRFAGSVIFIILVGFATFHLTHQVQQWQADAWREQEKMAKVFTTYLQPYAPQTIIFERGFGLAWSHYPLTVIADTPTSYEEMRILEERLPLDMVVVNDALKRDTLIAVTSQGLLKQPYSLLFPYDIEGYYFFNRSRTP